MQSPCRGRHGKGHLTLVLLTLGALGDTLILVPSTLTSVTAGVSHLAAGQGIEATQPPRQEFLGNQVLWVSGDCKVLRADESRASPSASYLTVSLLIAVRGVRP